MKTNNSAAVLQAAAEGQGIALARSVMARDDLASGRLVRLFADISFPSVLAYFVMYRAETSLFPRVIAFRKWLLEEGQMGELSWSDPVVACGSSAEPHARLLVQLGFQFRKVVASGLGKAGRCCAATL